MLPGWDKLQDLRRGGETPPPETKPDITQAVSDRADSLTIERLLHKKGLTVDRLKEKLVKAGGVAARATAAIEVEADKLIAREQTIAQKTAQAFAPHHAMLDSHNRDLDQLEDALKMVSNGAPLPGSEG